MQLETSRSEQVRMKMESKRRTKQKEQIELWISKHHLPSEMRQPIIDDMNQRFKEDEDVYLENLLPNLPGELQNIVKEHIGLKRLKTVSFFTSINMVYSYQEPITQLIFFCVSIKNI